MEWTSFNIEEHSITYQVNWLGIESISVNGTRISKKLSLGKRVHTFELLIDGSSETFHIESKQSFTHCNITVSVFKNNVLLDTKVVAFYAQITGRKNPADTSNNSDSTFIVGMLFIVFSLCFDWSKIFLFIGLIFLFDAISKKDKPSKASENNNNDLDLKD